MFKRLRKYLREVKMEWSKVSKPTYRDIWGSTVIVIVATGIVAVYLWVIDISLSRLIKLLFF